MMKKQRKALEDYPYLTYWIEVWGEMQTTTSEYGQSRLTLLDEGGTCYEDEGSETFAEALEKAERYLREVESERFAPETIEALEGEYEALGLD
jgi:hypothetical protein